VVTTDELVALGENITYWNADMNHIKTYAGDTIDTNPMTFLESGGWTMNGAIPNNEGQSNYREIELDYDYLEMLPHLSVDDNKIKIIDNETTTYKGRVIFEFTLTSFRDASDSDIAQFKKLKTIFE
jgi:hypothetical protein